jgi:AraC family transcriptional regulator, regulatory protein of adaptative response / methylated-DNA-[protein]-cysteine methyltransferase
LGDSEEILESELRAATKSYGEIAAAIGYPNAARAVTRACAANSVAIAIPRHRMLREDVGMAGYRWDAARQRKLLER